MGARKQQGLNRRGKIGSCHLCLREEILPFNFTFLYILSYIFYFFQGIHSSYKEQTRSSFTEEWNRILQSMFKISYNYIYHTWWSSCYRIRWSRKIRERNKQGTWCILNHLNGCIYIGMLLKIWLNYLNTTQFVCNFFFINYGVSQYCINTFVLACIFKI